MRLDNTLSPLAESSVLSAVQPQWLPVLFGEVQCEDTRSSSKCTKWYKKGNCERKRKKSKKICKETCGLCDSYPQPLGLCSNTCEVDPGCCGLTLIESIEKECPLPTTSSCANDGVCNDGGLGSHPDAGGCAYGTLSSTRILLTQ